MRVDNVTDKKITVILLNWKRPHNASKIVNSYLPFRRIGEIILWNNNLECKFKIHHRKIKYFESQNYFTLSRYAAVFFASNDDIMFHDDDLILKEEQIERLFEAHLEYPHSIVGCFGRNLKNGVYVKEYSFGKVDVVLGRVMLFQRSLIANFLKNCPPFHGALEDDILFSLSQTEKPVAIDVGAVKELPKRYALSKRPYHLNRRQEMVEYCLVTSGHKEKKYEKR
ncbi:MAG: glycosyltransferase family A protein [Patescibacteria group bacterium]